jgi:hypothetical protein
MPSPSTEDIEPARLVPPRLQLGLRRPVSQAGRIDLDVQSPGSNASARVHGLSGLTRRANRTMGSAIELATRTPASAARTTGSEYAEGSPIPVLSALTVSADHPTPVRAFDQELGAVVAMIAYSRDHGLHALADGAARPQTALGRTTEGRAFSSPARHALQQSRSAHSLLAGTASELGSTMPPPRSLLDAGGHAPPRPIGWKRGAVRSEVGARLRMLRHDSNARLEFEGEVRDQLRARALANNAEAIRRNIESAWTAQTAVVLAPLRTQEHALVHAEVVERIARVQAQEEEARERTRARLVRAERVAA